MSESLRPAVGEEWPLLAAAGGGLKQQSSLQGVLLAFLAIGIK